MKARIIILLAAFIMAFSFDASAQKKKDANLDEVTFATSMECKNCEKKCNANLPFEKGVIDYKSDLATHTIYFKFDTRKTSREKLAQAIRKLGYTAEEVETVQKNK